MSSANRVSESSAAQAKREKRIGGAYHTVSAVPAQSRCRRAALALLLTLPLLAPAAYAQEAATAPTVTSVTFYSDEAVTEITEATIGARFYVAVEFSENVQNQNTVFDFDNLANTRKGKPNIQQRSPSRLSGGSPLAISATRVIAYDAVFDLSVNSACRATSAPPASRYLCYFNLGNSHQPGLLQIRIPAGAEGATDLAGNSLAAEYVSPNSLTLLERDPPSVTSVVHYPTAAAARAGSGPIDATWESTNPIYSVIQFAGPSIERSTFPEGVRRVDPPDAKPHIFYQLGSATRMQFGYAAGVTDPPPDGYCRFLSAPQNLNNPSFWCVYTPSLGDSGTYQIIVGEATRGINHVPLSEDYDDDLGITLAVVAGDAALSIADVSVDEGGTATFSVSVDTAVSGGFTVDASLSDVTAIAGQDYTAAATRTLTFAGSAAETQTFTIDITDDAVAESDENLTVLLHNVQQTTTVVEVDTATLTIQDNDTAVLTIEDVRVDEGDGVATVSVSLGSEVYTGFTIDLALTPDSATGGEDYAQISPSLRFTGTAGETQTFTVTIIDDREGENDEEILTVSMIPFDFNVSFPFDALTGEHAPPSGQDTILNLDDTATITIVDNENVTLLFGAAIPDQVTYTFSTPIPTLTLPEASDGTAPYTYTLTPAASLPAGLSFDADVRTLSGTPLIADKTPFSLQYTATDANGITVTHTLSLRIQHLIETMPTLYYHVGESVNLTFPVPTVGSTPFAYSLSEALSIDGLAFTPDTTPPAISGMPTEETLNQMPITRSYIVRDSTGERILIILFSIRVTTINLPPITNQHYETGESVNLTLPEPTGGVAPFTYTLLPSLPAMLPPGLTFDANMRTLSGVPTAAFDSGGGQNGAGLMTYRIRDSNGNSITSTFFLLVTVSPSDATLSGLSVSLDGGAALPLTQSDGTTPGFAFTELTYTATAPAGTTTVTVAATATNTTAARIQYAVGDPASATFVDSGDNLSVEAGENTITVRVIAEDGNTTRNYTITLTAPGTAPVIAGLGESIDVAPFNFGDGVYRIDFSVTPATATVSISPDSSTAFTTWSLVDNGLGNYSLRIGPPAADSAAGGPYTETLTVTASEDERLDGTQEVTFTIRQPIALTGIPSGGNTRLVYGNPGTPFALVAEPANAVLTATSANGSFSPEVTPSVSGVDGEWTLRVTPPSTNTVYTDTITVTATDPADIRGTSTFEIPFSVPQQPVTLDAAGANGTVLDTSPYNFAESRVLEIGFEQIGTTVALASKNNWFSIVDAGISTGLTRLHRFNVAAPSSVAGIPSNVVASNDVYTDTLVFTGSAPNYATRTLTLTYTLRQEVGLTFTNTVNTEFANFGDTARAVNFNVALAGAEVEITSTHDVFTITKTDDEGASRAFTIAPPADGGRYADDVTVTVTDPDGARQPSTRQFTFTIGARIVLNGLPPDPDLQIDYGGMLSYTITADPVTTAAPDSVTVATRAGIFSPAGTMVDLVDNNDGTWILNVTAPPNPPSDSRGTSFFVFVTATAPGRPDFERLMNFFIRPVIMLTGFPTGTDLTLDYGGAPTTFDLTLNPGTASEVTTLTATSNDVVTADIVNNDDGTITQGGTVILTVTPPHTGTVTTDTVTINGVADRPDVDGVLRPHVAFMGALTFTTTAPRVFVLDLPDSISVFLNAPTTAFTIRSSVANATLTASSTDTRVVPTLVRTTGGAADEWTLTVTGPTAAPEFAGTVTITATDQNGEYDDGTATVPFTVGSGVASADATLSALSVMSSDGAAVTFTPAFDAATTAYTANAPGGTTTVTVAVTADDGANIQYAVGEPATATFSASSNLTVSTYENVLTVRVIAEDGITTRDYTITLTVPATSANVTLKALSVMPSGGAALTLTPTFDAVASATAYTATAPVGTTTVTATATPTNDGASIKYAVGANPASGAFSAGGTLTVSTGVDNVLTARVTAENGNTTRDYTITLTVPVDAVSINPAQQTRTVPTDWALIPNQDGTPGPDLGHGQSFRLLFITSGMRTAISPNIDSYNLFVQNAANGATGDGLPIAAFGNQFRALISTAAVDARDNTGTTAGDADAPIYWLNGTNLAVDYANFYDGNWNREGSGERDARLRNQHGVKHVSPNTSGDPNGSWVWTGSNPMGIASQPAGSIVVNLGRPAFENQGSEISRLAVANSQSWPVYAISPLLTVQGMGTDATVNALSVTPGGSALTLTQSDGTTTGFATAVLTYTATAQAGTTTVTVAAVATDSANAIVRYAVGNPATATFTASGTLTVATGPNILTARVTSGDTSATRYYTIILTVLAPPTVTLVLTPASINESGTDNRSTVTATLDRASTAITTLTITATPGSATTAGDYTLSANPTLTIAAGTTMSTGTVTITAIDNNVDAPDKEVMIGATVQSGPEGVVAPPTVTLTITDDDATPTVTLKLGSTSISENGGSSTITATLNRASAVETVVTINAPTGANANDYTVSSPATLTFAADATTSTGVVTITARDNNVDAPDKDTMVSATAANTHPTHAPPRPGECAFDYC